MALLDSTVQVLHVLFAGLWAGATLFVAGAVLPAARDGRLSADALAWMTDRFSYVSIASVAVLFMTGGHLAGTRYTFGSLTSTGRGHLVVTMVALWFVLAGVLHAGTSKLRKNLDRGSTEAVEASSIWFQIGGVVAFALLVVAGLL